MRGMGPGYDPYESSVGAALRLGKLVDVPIFGPIIDRSVRPGLIDLLPRSRWMEVQYGPSSAILSEETLERTLLGMLRSKLSAVRETSQVRADLARLTPRLHGVAQPTLIISGGLDPVIPILEAAPPRERSRYGRSARSGDFACRRRGRWWPPIPGVPKLRSKPSSRLEA